MDKDVFEADIFNIDPPRMSIDRLGCHEQVRSICRTANVLNDPLVSSSPFVNICFMIKKKYVPFIDVGDIGIVHLRVGLGLLKGAIFSVLKNATEPARSKERHRTVRPK
ncbi:hypothetical protein FQN57_006582 [Myotisia sp. PD_48]|nr:hypothetical protein FQN57_006582 [Myotisia sp. PD_48]